MIGLNSEPSTPGGVPKLWVFVPPIGLVAGGAVLIWGMGGITALRLPAAVPRDASALFDASSKVVATKIESVDFIGLPPSRFDKSIETRGDCSALGNPETRCHTCSWSLSQAVPQRQQQFITSGQHSATSRPRQPSNSAFKSFSLRTRQTSQRSPDMSTDPGGAPTAKTVGAPFVRGSHDQKRIRSPSDSRTNCL